jgi:hypothetical protein
MDRQTRDQMVARYKDGYRLVAAALQGATDAELDAKPGPGKWSAREIVHHLGDSEMTSAVRLRLLVAEDRAQIRPYDQELFARALHYDRPIAASLRAFQAARESMGEDGQPSRARSLQRRALAGNLRGPCAQSRRSDQARVSIHLTWCRALARLT